MSIMMKLGRRVNSFLIRFGYKIAILNRKSKRTFPEEQLLKALVELNALYKTCVFNKELTGDEESLELLSNSIYTKFGTGFYIINYLQESLDREGDVCEFGVAQGTISALLAHEIKNTHKNIWLFDSFEGFPEPSEKDILIHDIMNLGSIGAYKGMLAFSEEEVKSRLSDINFPPERIRIVPGFIEKTIKGPELPQAVCFAYVDFNFYEPIVIALNFLDTVLQEGGVIIIDDYDDFLKGVKSAVDEFYDSRREKYTLKFPVKSAGKFCILCKNN